MHSLFRYFVFILFILMLHFSKVFSADRIVIDTFSSCKSHNNLPCGWKERHKFSNIELNNESGNYYLTITTNGTVKSIGKKISVNVMNTPVLHWKWRMHQLPNEGDESQKKKDDSGGGIYIIFQGTFPSNKIIKYVWSSTLPDSTLTFSPFNHDVAIVVVQTGSSLLDQWISEQRNVSEDYKRAFHTTAPMVGAIALESDSDNTHSHSSVDFDNLIFTSQNE